MPKKKARFVLSLILKIVLTGAALFFVFKKVGEKEVFNAILGVNPFYFALAVLAFNVSKIIASFRLNHFYHAANLKLDWKTNLKLYYVGMFYNLFLPGAISGDAYKVYLLKEAGVEAKTKKLISASFLDRVSGMAFLTILGLLFLLFSSFIQDNALYNYSIIGLAILVLPCYYIFLKILFKDYVKKFWITNGLSLGVQLGQVLAAWFLLMALAEHQLLMEHLALFMLSSVVTVIPFTIGGAGARELVFYYGFKYLGINESVAVAFATLFFGVTAISALIGLFFIYFIDREIAKKQTSAA